MNLFIWYKNLTYRDKAALILSLTFITSFIFRYMSLNYSYSILDSLLYSFELTLIIGYFVLVLVLIKKSFLMRISLLISGPIILLITLLALSPFDGISVVILKFLYLSIPVLYLSEFRDLGSFALFLIPMNVYIYAYLIKFIFFKNKK